MLCTAAGFATLAETAAGVPYTVDATQSWQQTSLTLTQGDQLTVAAAAGQWTVGSPTWPSVGVDGYPAAIDQQILQVDPACKVVDLEPYGVLLAKIGINGTAQRLALGNQAAGQTGPLYLRINDADACLLDNAGTISVDLASNAPPAPPPPQVPPPQQPPSQAGDTDGDGLLDSWETRGIDTNGDGRPEVPLQQMGADPNHKDLFVELDAMAKHQLTQEALDTVTAAFLKAPLPRPDPDGTTTGIRLHIDAGPTSTMNPLTGEKWGSLSRADSALPHQDVLGSNVGSNYSWDAFDGIKKANFDPARAPAFRYALSVHQYGSADNFSSGIARGIPASDFIVALGRIGPGGIDANLGGPGPEAGTFMHELGHTLGLRHGGGDDTGYKPNYLSIMNYSFQFGGLRRAGSPTPIYDYSRFGPTSAAGTIGNLDENALMEPQGIPATGAAVGMQSLRYCGTSTTPEGPFTVGSPVDWNCNRAIDGPDTVSINQDAPTQTLASFEDWPGLVYKAGDVGIVPPAPPLPPQTPRIDTVPVQKLQRPAAVSAKDTIAPRITITVQRHRKRRHITVVATDNRAISQLVVRINGRQRIVTPESDTARRVKLTLRLRRGRNRIVATAFDVVGNQAPARRLILRG
jgi:hypothetical protein